MPKRHKMVEAVLLFDERSICGQMLYTEFETVLDGVLSLPDYSGQNLRAAFVLIDARLHPRAVVFFTIAFDAQGMVDGSWDIPLRQLAERSETSMDLGSGLIHVVCASHCPLPKFKDQLWNPVRNAARNDLLLISDALACNPLGLLTANTLSRFTLNIPALHMTDEYNWYGVTRIDDAAFIEESDERDRQRHLKMARLIKQQRTLLDNVTLQCEELKCEHEKVMIKKQEEHDLQRLAWQHGADQQQAKLTKRLDKQQREQARYLIDHARHLEETSSASAQKLSNLERDIRIQHDINDRLSAQLSQQLDNLHTLQKQVADRDEQVAELQFQLAGQEPNEVLAQLAAQGVVFVAFHPGAGHLTIALSDLRRYQKDPIHYVANKCEVSPAQYRRWLQHYKNACCEAELLDGRVCNAALKRVDTPSHFMLGVSNFCAKHKETGLAYG